MKKEEIIDNMMEKVLLELKENNIIKEGNIVILTGGRDYINDVTYSKRIGGIVIV